MDISNHACELALRNFLDSTNGPEMKTILCFADFMMHSI